MITVHVKLFATLRRHYPELGIGEREKFTLPRDTTVGELLERMAVPRDEVKVVFVNGRVEKKDHVLNDGDELGIFPPVGGG